MKKLLTLISMLAVVAFISVAATLSVSNVESTNSASSTDLSASGDEYPSQGEDVSVWTIVGSQELLSSYWDPSDSNNDMTLQKEGVYVLEKKDVQLKSGATYEFKVVGNYSWDVNYGDGGMASGDNVKFSVDQSGVYNVWFYFYPDNGHQLAYSYEFVSGDSLPMECIYSISYCDYGSFPFFVMGYVPEFYDCMMTDYGAMYKYVTLDNEDGEKSDYIVTTNSGVEYYRIPLESPSWHQYFLADRIPTVEGGDYVVKAMVRAAEPVTINVNMGWGWGDDEHASATVSIGTEWQEVEWEYSGIGGTSCNLVAQPGTTTATIYWNKVQVYNKPSESMVQETINFDSYSGVYFDGSQAIAGNYTNVLFAQGQGSNTPYGKGSNIYFNPGNTMTLTSDLDIVKVEFSTYNWMGSYIVSSGTISDNIWRGNTSELTITSPTDESYNRFYSITVTLDDPSQDALLERLTAQLEATTTALAGLTYAVPGKAELETLATEAATATLETEAAQLKAYIKQLREQTAAVVALDGKYKTLATLAAAVATTAESNPYADATILAEASALVQEVEAGLLACTYTAAQVDPLIATLTTYNQQLADVYLTIHVEEAGSLGDLVLEKGVDFGDVVGLRVSGKLNTADQTTLKGFNKLQLIDLKETNLTTIAQDLFRDKTTLKKAILPKNATNVGYESFYNCTALEEVELPATLLTIDSYAFYNCRSLQSITFPEGLTMIGYEAFQCNTDGYYDEQGIWRQRGGSLKEVTLPSTLTSLGSYAFAYQTQLEKVTMLDGLTYISEDAFYNCSNLSDLTLPATLTEIGGYAFSYCSALTKLELPENLQRINNYAFRYCSSLEEVVLPSTLQYVYRPFDGCEKLTKMTIKAIAAPATNGYSIMGKATLAAACTLYVPELSINVYKQALNWNEFNIVGADIMPENITINTDYRLNWPENLALDYRPNIFVASNASLWVSGNSVLSAGNFTLAYSYYDASNNSRYNSELQRYEYNRDNCFAALLNHAQYARADKVSVDAYTRANCWDFMSMPFDINTSEIGLMFAETPYVIRKYDGAKRAQGLTGETWVNVEADETIPAGQGFILQSASTDGNRYYNGFTFNAINNANKNNIFANDDVAIELTEYAAEFEHNRSWNFIGNPYPAYFDIRAIKTKAPITVWDNYNQNYQAYSPVDDAYILNPGQAFFIQRPIDEAEATLVFQKEGRQIDMEVRPLEDVANRAARFNERSVFNLTVNGNEMGDRTRFVINNSALMEYEAGRDANKFMSDEQSVQLYTIENGVQFAINERPLGNAVIELGLMVSKAGNYTITLNTTVDNEVYLIDRLTGMEVRIDGIEGGYTFDAEQGTIEGRFAIRLGVGDVTGIKSIERDFNNGANYYDLQGRKIDQPAKGVYINNGKKVVIQ